MSALLLALLSMLAGPRHGLGAPLPTAHSDAAEDFARILHSIEPGVTEEELAQRTHELTQLRGVVALYLEAVATGRLPATPLGETVELTSEHLDLLERASLGLARGDVVQAVEEGLESRTDAAWRRAALELMGLHAMAGELSVMIELADARALEGELDDSLLEAFRDAMIMVLRRDHEALGRLEAMPILPEPAGVEIVHSVGIAGDPEGLAWLAEQLSEPDRTDAALQEIGRLAPSVPFERTEPIAEEVRPFLRSKSVARRKQTMRALAGLRDARAIPHLIELLEAASAGERKAAWSALRSLTGRDLPQRADVWRGWLGEELRWWGQEAESTLEQLWSEEEAECVAAVVALSRRSLQRDRLARELARVLDEHPSPEVRGRTCLGLAQLGSRAACEELVLTLADPDESIREHAWTALRSITGLAVPPEREAWQDALRRRH